jgi:hypothetical protein
LMFIGAAAVGRSGVITGPDAEAGEAGLAEGGCHADHRPCDDEGRTESHGCTPPG